MHLDSLEGSALLGGLARDPLVELLASLPVERRKTGEALITQGAPSDCLLIVPAGRVRVLRRAPGEDYRTLDIENGPCVLGEIGLLTGSLRNATVVATEPLDVLIITRPRLDQLVAQHPAAGEYLRTLVDQRLGNEG